LQWKMMVYVFHVHLVYFRTACFCSKKNMATLVKTTNVYFSYGKSIPKV
jgi:hypothetical protein